MYTHTDILVNIYKINDKVDKYILIRVPPNRLFIYSGSVATPDAIYTGRNTHPNNWIIIIALFLYYNNIDIFILKQNVK